MDPALDLQARRHFLSVALTSQARSRLGGRIATDSSPTDLLALARRLGEEMGFIQRTYGFHSQPPYPGVTAGPEEVDGGLRLVLACTAFDQDGTPLGVVFTTLIPGRLPQVSVAPLGARIPEAWQPLADRL